MQCVNVSRITLRAIQLTKKGKCPRAFHVTCARDDEQVVHRVWEVEEYVPVPIPEGAAEGTHHEFVKEKSLKTEILCPTHNPVSARHGLQKTG